MEKIGIQSKIRGIFKREIQTPIQNKIDTPKGALIGLNLLCYTVECILLTPYVTGEKAISLLIVAKGESGKTSVMKRYRNNKCIIYMTDCTAYGIQRDYLPKIASGEVKTMMIADLTTPLGRAQKTRKAFISFLNNLSEEGTARITTYATQWDKEVNCNIITAITDKALSDGRHDWAGLAFLSRFIIFSFSYPKEVIAKIMKLYDKQGLINFNDNVMLTFPEKSLNIELSEEIASRLTPIAEKIGQDLELYGIRAKINLRSFLKAIALKNGHLKVEESDFKKLLEISEYMNSNMKEVKIEPDERQKPVLPSR